MSDQPAGDASFEELYQQLEAVTAQLEEGSLTLEEALGLYEQGMHAAQGAQELLTAIELRIERLRDAFDTLGPQGAAGG